MKIVLALALGAGLLAGCGGGSKVTLNGDLTVANPSTGDSPPTIDAAIGSRTCTGSGGFDDVTSGATVTVQDASGKVIGTAALGDGQTQLDKSGFAYACVWKLMVSGLPSSKFYKVEVSHRGTVTYTLAQVKAGQVNLSLGTS